jgi:hypothetical protein
MDRHRVDPGIDRGGARLMPILADPDAPPPWWGYLAPYLQKLVVAALARNDTRVNWPMK